MGGSEPDGFPDELPDRVRWVQLPSAVERWLDRIDRERQWTSASGAFGRPVAEHALTLMLAGVHRAARVRARHALDATVLASLSATVGIIGTGSIGRALIGCSVRSASRSSP